MKTYQIVGTYEDDATVYLSQPFEAESPEEAMSLWKCEPDCRDAIEAGLFVEFVIEGKIVVHETPWNTPTPTGKAFQFRTDAGDQDDILAGSLEEAAVIARGKIPQACWDDGAWGIVKDAETGEQMDVEE